MSTFLSWTSPSCIEKSRVPFPSFGYREKEYDFAQLAVLHKREREAYLPKHANTSAPRPLPGHDQPVQQSARRTGPAGSPRRRRSTRGRDAADGAHRRGGGRWPGR